MPGGKTVAETRPRPARRGCRGGWRARRARERGSGEQLTVFSTGADGPRRVECYQSPDTDYRRGNRDPAESRQARRLPSEPLRLEQHNQHHPARRDTPPKASYNRIQLLTVRDRLNGDSARGVAETIRRHLPAQLIRRHETECHPHDVIHCHDHRRPGRADVTEVSPDSDRQRADRQNGFIKSYYSDQRNNK